MGCRCLLWSIILKRSISLFVFQGNPLSLLSGTSSSTSSFYFCFSYFVSLGETTIHCGLGGSFICESILCSLCGFNIFGARAAFSMDVCHLFPQSVLVIIFDSGLQMRGFVPSPGVLEGSSNSSGPPGHTMGVEVV